MFKFNSHCNHRTPKEIMELNGVKIFASSVAGVFELRATEKTLVLNLTGESHYGIMPKELMAHSYYQFEEILINWTDGGMPPLLPTFWPAVIQYAADNKFEKVLVHCMAGHGRTGTALAALRVSILKETPATAVDALRDMFCQELVETETQVNYLSWVAEEFDIEDDSQDIEHSYAKLGSLYSTLSSTAQTKEADKPVSGPPAPAGYDWDDWFNDL